MSNILVSGLVNTETTVKVRGFPINYYPIDYPFFGVNTRVSGVAFNILKALTALGDSVNIASMVGTDFAGEYVCAEIQKTGANTRYLSRTLQTTANSVVLYEESGRRQIYCDLKDLQEQALVLPQEALAQCDVVVACNINFNRELLRQAREAGKCIVTDVHVLGDIRDSYNADFMRYANILFLSDENLPEDYQSFLWELAHCYGNDIIVLGRGSKGAALYVRSEGTIEEFPVVQTGPVVNTVGAGDALFSAFVHYYARGLSPREALMRAQIFASVKIGFDGAAVGFPDEKTVESFYFEKGFKGDQTNDFDN